MRKHNRKIIYLAGFLFYTALALTSYINSSFLEQFINKDYLGFVYTAASLVTILELFQMPKLLQYFGNRRTILVSTFSTFIALLLLSLGNSSIIIIPAFILYFTSIGLVISSLDVFIEDFSEKDSIGSFRGFYLMIISLAWVVSQLISGSIINKSSFEGIYLLSAGFVLLVIFVFSATLHKFKDPIYTRVSVLKTIKTFIRNKNISKIYLTNFILQFFYAWMVIYTPIYLHEYMHFPWDKIGLIFSIMLLPFVLLPFPLGKISDKIGEKKMLIVGFLIIAISVFIIPFINESIFYVWALILFSTRLGAATVETMNEAYFFKIITEKNADEISFFRNASSVAYIIAPFFASMMLISIPTFKYLYFVLCAIVLIGLLVSLRLRDVR